MRLVFPAQVVLRLPIMLCKTEEGTAGGPVSCIKCCFPVQVKLCLLLYYIKRVWRYDKYMSMIILSWLHGNKYRWNWSNDSLLWKYKCLEKVKSKKARKMKETRPTISKKKNKHKCGIFSLSLSLFSDEMEIISFFYYYFYCRVALTTTWRANRFPFPALNPNHCRWARNWPRDVRLKFQHFIMFRPKPRSVSSI